MIKVAINGFGRIGRLVFRIMEEDPELEVVAINDLTDSEQLAYLLKYDTSHRSYLKNEISYTDDGIIVKGRKIKVYAETDPNNLPWKDLGIDVVFECTGKFTNKEKAEAHINAGAKKVIISAPAKGDLKTIVYGVNEETLDGSETIISAASCTTNCLAPVVNVLNNEFGIKKGLMTTVHAYTNDQTVLDVAHKKGAKSRRGRAAGANIIPTSTGAASAIGKVIPSLNGKLDGSALRVPVTTGSIVDLTLELNTKVTKEEINLVLKNNANETLGYTEDPIVSSDVIGETHGGVVDSLLTNVLEKDGTQLVKVVAWYDNEMSYSAQMVRTAKYLFK
ncbi:MAG TPA: type I glyceraldehyde-3-phosphate dehydrogenase [Candidatus Coprosoma intestinipullorum]|uniref:Glyceraldehyde-3-phosphate dehydrogenase n=1 Tax=Candidatus Coprosoma intestinipullorum TaxID=2840752 RepID=A0A9D0ZUA7_9FIRM|nr:type I glyceraldehyde-3-phosphate dehydrogenase [Candidatus Coprosoma intestinipullorum]